MFFNQKTKLLAIALLAVSVSVRAQKVDYSAKVERLLSQMTLEEKLGQLNQYSNASDQTGPITRNSDGQIDEIRKGRVGSMLNVRGAKNTRLLQQEALKSRLKIPMIFGQDVVHGYRVTFPLPLAEAASWDLEMIEKTARVAATEAAASGIQWTFAPMVDISRDARWGRVMEGAGEDTYLGSKIAVARVRGFQGKGIGQLDAVMACAKHFAAYGAAVAGRDYNSVDMSLRQLWQYYLPPFKAAVDAGAATLMNSFNDLNGTPATASAYLQRDILKGAWKFDGFVVSDWGSIGEMIPHGYAKDCKDAAEMAMNGGSDMDMESRCYIENLAVLLKEGKVKEAQINDAVRRILTKKFELGLFENPYRFSDEKREKQVLNSPAFREVARDMARKSIVLLKNEKQVLPLAKNLKTIALVGPLAKSNEDMKGFWSVDWGKNDQLVSLYEGVQAKVGNQAKLLYAQGCGVEDTSTQGFAQAVQAAQQADVVVMAVGEKYDMSGEGHSRSNIHLPGVQEELIKAIQATGKPVVVLVMGGRPLIFNWTADHVPAIAFTWWLGSEAGNAMADVLFGDYNPSGKLPMSFPRSEGQLPLYYNYLHTGRWPQNDSEKQYKSAYLDVSNSPRYAFGYGLSYTKFEYSDLKLSRKNMTDTDQIEVSFVLKNAGTREGEEVVQLYLRDVVAQPLRPVQELKDFRKVKLKAQETTQIRFVIDREKLAFYNDQLDWITQAGDFDLMIGAACNDIRLTDHFTLTK
ncbi:beta-glucosidase [Flexibacter flexilis DSM 6793]|uniref:Periplasmic beta-glucosidase n=1 Tax=Flexibacter flexilis DSM 6793 TaxID=927664 RepID=A0A1I1MN01_9BACT|nr:glycoside hydrolase family 3 N-terminal domain-containing protein [Flexibacter flexilis]SFC83983.1 beta-glucosidase [Flexibacter flexilis DSM 6793]